MPRALLLLAALALAGCTAPSSPAPGDLGAPRGFEVAAGSTGCTEVGLGNQVAMEHARSLLPPGFAPRDAAGFLGYPAPVGRGFVASGLLRCEAGDLDPGPLAWADVIVYVQKPTVPGRELPDGPHDFYLLAMVSSGPEHLRRLAAAHVPSSAGSVAHEVLALSARGALADAEGALVEARIAVAPAGSTQYGMRFWHVSEAGLASFEFERSEMTQLLGAPVSCALRPGSAHARAFGGVGCAGPTAVAGLFPEPSDIVGTLRFEPGVRPG